MRCVTHGDIMDTYLGWGGKYFGYGEDALWEKEGVTDDSKYIHLLQKVFQSKSNDVCKNLLYLGVNMGIRSDKTYEFVGIVHLVDKIFELEAS